MKLIQTTTLSSTQASVEFISLPQTFTDLAIFISARSSTASADDPILYRINSLTSGYTGKALRGNGSAVISTSLTTNTSAAATGTWGRMIEGSIPPNGHTANTFSNTVLYLSNYTSASAKSLSVDNVSENNSTAAYQDMASLGQTTTSAVTTLAFALQNGSYVSGSTFSIYGITKGSDGITTAS